MDPLRITYAAELLAVALAAAIGGLTGYRASAHYRRVAYGLAVVGLLCFCLLPISARLLPLLYHIPQPVSITTDLIMAIGFLLIGVAYRRSWDRSRGRILVSVLAIVATSFVLGAPAQPADQRSTLRHPQRAIGRSPRDAGGVHHLRRGVCDDHPAALRSASHGGGNGDPLPHLLFRHK